MIETKQAIDNLESILSVDGLTGIYIGPNDLALSLGHNPTSNPTGEVLDIIVKIKNTAKNFDKKAGIFCLDSKQASKMINEQFDYVNVIHDAYSMMLHFEKEMKILEQNPKI
eukprot:Pgem_evm1s5211